MAEINIAPKIATDEMLDNLGDSLKQLIDTANAIHPGDMDQALIYLGEAAPELFRLWVKDNGLVWKVEKPRLDRFLEKVRQVPLRHFLESERRKSGL